MMLMVLEMKTKRRFLVLNQVDILILVETVMMPMQPSIRIHWTILLMGLTTIAMGKSTKVYNSLQMPMAMDLIQPTGTVMTMMQPSILPPPRFGTMVSIKTVMKNPTMIKMEMVKTPTFTVESTAMISIH